MRRGGFTLLEVVLAILLTVGLTAGMYGLYGRMLQVRDVAGRKMDTMLTERLLMDRMTTELRSAMVVSTMNISLDGQADQAEWPCLQLPGLAAWADRSGITTDEVAVVSDMAVVGYRLRTTVDEDSGEDVVVGLERVCQRVVMADTLVESSDADTEQDETAARQVEFLTDRLKYLAFRYHDGSGWSTTWSDDALPSAVEITLGVEPIGLEEEVEDYEARAEIFRRTVYVPNGASQSEESSNSPGMSGGIRG